ncbi:flagellar basal-body MS-ring/collar protein FliF [Photobacterium damselae]|uniref:flagellar basal-body MS-ring/collar protein FliF n=1 Tax=Photobacterium damselae TaxID=38293 RepID=UPI001EED27FC|nr:flagellar basal-body MS-ring/collar protein FliF [Photobacterium damselae]UKA04617.1 flagellar M-ring protein FliF [Photobacterium damselae subsp. damselae]
MLTKLEPIKKKWNELSLNKKALLTAAIASSIAVSAFSVYKFNQPDYVSVMSHLDRVSMQKIIPALESAKIEFKISPDNTTLFVDKSQEDAASIILAKDGLPLAPTSGYSHLENGKTPYLTRSAEQQLERQVLEENVEIAIKKIKSIQDVDVSLALSENSAFLQDVKPSTASVVLTIKSGHSLTQAQIQGISNIVANAVPNLEPKNVAIIDQTGRILSVANDENGDIPTQLSHKIEIERIIAQKITQVVAPIVGLDNFRVNVSADINYDHTELTSDEPNANHVVLSKQSDTNYDKTMGGAQGVAGALSNEPPKHATFNKKIKPQSDEENGKGVSHKNVTTNYIVGKTITHTKKASGDIEKLSIAVLIDSSSIKPKDKAAFLKTIKPIIEASVGYDQKRGDTISIDTTQFQIKAEKKQPEESAYSQLLDEFKNPSTSTLEKCLDYFLNLCLFLALYFMFFKPILKALRQEDEPTGSESSETSSSATDSNDQLAANLSPDDIAKMHHENLKKTALNHLQNHPDAAKDVFNSWVKDIDLKSKNDIEALSTKEDAIDEGNK